MLPLPTVRRSSFGPVSLGRLGLGRLGLGRLGLGRLGLGRLDLGTLCLGRVSIAIAVAVLGSACSMTKLAVETQADVMELASPTIEEQTDYEVARLGIPANLMQVDGLLAVAPENEPLLTLGAKGWGSYAYGFVEDAMQVAETAGNLEEADAQRDRARAMYLKARDYAFNLMDQRISGFRSALERDPDELAKFLKEEATDAEDAPALFWTAYAWGSAINISRDDPTMLADLAFPRVLAERAVALDERYYNAAGHVLLGVFHSSLGEAIGGDPEKGREHFERALELTSRKSHVVQVNYAESYAVQKQDRDLFVKLLEEVRNPKEPDEPALALANTVARRRAERLMSQLDNLILPPLPPLDDSAPAPDGSPDAAGSPEPGPGAAPPSGAPATPEPATPQPAAPQPAAPQPAAKTPATKAPATKAPATKAPATKAPAARSPSKASPAGTPAQPRPQG